MEERLECDKHGEQIKTLFKQGEVLDKRMEKLECDKVLMYSLDKNIALITQSISDINEYNKKQDMRMDEQHEINVKVSDNLTRLAEQYITLDNKVDMISNKTESLTKKVDENESKHNIDLRDINKDGKINLLKKYGEPAVIIGAIVTILAKLIEVFKG